MNTKPARKSLGVLANGSSMVLFGLLTLAKYMGFDIPLVDSIVPDPDSLGALPELGLSGAILGLLGRLKAKVGIKGF